MSDNNIHINTPEIGPYTQLKPFRFWCQKVLPLVYDESLSYYELLCKVVDYLNKTMEDVDQMITDMGDFQTAYTDFTTETRDAYVAFSREVSQAVEGLETFVNNYFNNLNVQTEINNKLDAMAAAGYFDELFTTLFQTDVINAAQIVTANWIAEHLLQETGYVIDNSLTVANAAADAKATGDRFAYNDSLLKPTVNNLVSKVNKNRYNGEVYNGYLSNSGELTVSGAWESTGLIYVGDLEQVVASYYNTADTIRKALRLDYCCTYDANGDFIERIYTTGLTTYTVTSGVSYIRFSYDSNNLTEIQVESGDTASAYAPYDYAALTKIVLKNVYDIANKIHPATKVEHNGVLLSDIIDDNLKPVYENVSLTFESKTGYYTAVGYFSEYADIYGATVSVTPDECYLLSSNSYYAMATVIFFDSNDQFVYGYKVSNDTAAFTDVPIKAPDNAATMLLQKHGSSTPYTLKKLTAYTDTVNSLLKDKKITVIGDSITEYNWRAKTNWAMFIAEWTGATIQNLGASGTGFAISSPYINRISNIDADTDIIGVAVSFNDLNAGLPIGNASDTGTDSLCGYVNDFFDALISAFPTTPIICYVQNIWNAARPGVGSASGLVEKIKEICEAKSVPFYDDMYKGSVLRPWLHDNRVVYFTSDNDNYPDKVGEEDTSHPNTEGHKVIARVLYPKFVKNLVATGLNYTAQ